MRPQYWNLKCFYVKGGNKIIIHLDYAYAAVLKSKTGLGSSPNYFNITPYDREGRLRGILCEKGKCINP